MTNYAMLGDMGTQALGAFASFSAQQTQIDMQASALKHRQVLADISSRLQRNAVTINESATQDAAARLGQSIQVASLQNKAQAQVSAAAAGVAGGSADATLRGLQRSELQAQYALKENLTSAMLSHDETRRGITLNSVLGQNTATGLIPSSPSMALLGLGAQIIDTYNSNQPAGQTTSDRIAKQL